MEIIVIDDHSTDDTETIARRVAGERARVIRQPQNVGKVRNFETGLRACRGQLIHQLHGDDLVGANFYSRMTSAFRDFPSAGAFFCEARYVNVDGEVVGRTGAELPATGLLSDWLPKIAVSQRIQAPSMVVMRRAYEEVGGFDRRLDMVEDWEMWIRIASRFDVGFVSDVYADYRLSPSGTSAQEVRFGKVANRIRVLIEIVDQYLPPALVESIRKPRNREMAQYLAEQIQQLVRHGQYGSLPRAYLDILRFSSDPRTIYRLIAYTFKAGRLAH
jgi:glycosyltransferase involved in cell wall biosynthesis